MKYEFYKLIIINLIIYLKDNTNKINYLFNKNFINSKNINNIINFYEILIKYQNNKELSNNFIILIQNSNATNMLNKYYKKKYFKYVNFANKNYINYNNIKLYNNTYYSITNYNDAYYICNLIFNFFKTKDIIITDATSNIGGNTLSFGLYNYKQINSVEINTECYKYLLNNIKCYNLNNIKTYNDDYLNIYKTLNQDVIFIDPPWGGIKYKSIENLDLFLNDINIVDIIEELFNIKKVKLVLIKAPFNYNIQLIYNKFNKYYIKKYKLNKYNIISILN